MQAAPLVFGAILALGLAGCSGGASEADYTPQREYSADISAALNHGPVASSPGMRQGDEPIGVFPWDMNERHAE